MALSKQEKVKQLEQQIKMYERSKMKYKEAVNVNQSKANGAAAAVTLLKRELALAKKK